MQENTTIQVSRSRALALRETFPNLTYDEIIQRLLGQDTFTPDTRVLEFTKLIKPGYQDEQIRQPGVNGLITGTLMHFPPGPSGLVEVRIVLQGSRGGNDPIFPSLEDAFVALDDSDLAVTGLAIPVQSRDNIRVEWYNYDGGFAHTVPVFVLVSRG